MPWGCCLSPLVDVKPYIPLKTNTIPRSRDTILMNARKPVTWHWQKVERTHISPVQKTEEGIFRPGLGMLAERLCQSGVII